MKYAAIYLRSSKDRSDVSIDAQRRKLREKAQNEGFRIVQEFIDAVESGKDEYRPGFMELHTAISNSQRGWNSLLLLDTSRLARDEYIAAIFERTAEKHGVNILYHSIPNADPVTLVLIKSVFRAIDQYHSLISKQKALAGMAENVRQGYRAGGRAPLGYELETIKTGAVRDGKHVTKTRLKPAHNAHVIGLYLKARANGKSRHESLSESGLDAQKSTLNGMERKALIYAGHSVWNMLNEKAPGGGYKNGKKYRPQDEWIVHKDTHTALITEDEAGLILQRLDERKRQERHHSSSKFLLTKFLESTDGRLFEGTTDGRSNKRYYRLKGKPPCYINADELEETIKKQLKSDLLDQSFITEVIDQIRKKAKNKTTNMTGELTRKIRELEQKIEKTVDLAIELEDPAPVMRSVDKLEKERIRLESELDAEKSRILEASTLSNFTELDINTAISKAINSVNDIDEVITSLLQKITVEPISKTITLFYRVTVASPRGRSEYPVDFMRSVASR